MNDAIEWRLWDVNVRSGAQNQAIKVEAVEAVLLPSGGLQFTDGEEVICGFAPGAWTWFEEVPEDET